MLSGAKHLIIKLFAPFRKTHPLNNTCHVERSETSGASVPDDPARLKHYITMVYYPPYPKSTLGGSLFPAQRHY